MLRWQVLLGLKRLFLPKSEAQSLIIVCPTDNGPVSHFILKNLKCTQNASVNHVLFSFGQNKYDT